MLVYFEISAIDGLESSTVCGELEKKTGHKIDWKALAEKFPDGNLTLGDLLDAVMQPESVAPYSNPPDAESEVRRRLGFPQRP